MTTQVLTSENQETQILITIQHSSSMPDPLNIASQDNVNQVGMLGVEKQLDHLDTKGSPIEVGGIHMTSKHIQEPKLYETQWGAVNMPRYVYKSYQGGQTPCPMDQNARIIVNSTPAFARMVSWKYAQMAAPQVEDDLLTKS